MITRRPTALAAACGLAMLLVPATTPGSSAHAADQPWPAPVAGHQAPKPGEHPRLFFRRADLSELRRRADSPQGRALVKRLRYLLDGKNGDTMPPHKNPMTTAYGKTGGPKPGKTELPVGTYSISHAAGYGMLYQLTGDKKYAELGKQCFLWAFEGVRDRDREARYSYKNPGGALRAGPSLGWYAVGYDLCYDGWDADFQRKATDAIYNYKQSVGKQTADLAYLVKGKRHMPASNHWGMQVGGGALAILATMHDPGADPRKTETLLKESQRAMIRNMTEGFGERGWFPEGDGTGVMASNIVFAPALQAWRTAGGLDFINPRPNGPWMYMKWVMRTVPRDGKPDVLKLGAYPHNVYARTGISGPGTYTLGFGVVTERQKPALLWLYNRAQKPYDDKNQTPFETTSAYPHHAVMALINWPFGLTERDPALCIPPAVRDGQYGFYMMRNRWRDPNDVLVQIQAHSTRGWHRATTRGDVHVWGHGQKLKWGRVPGPIAHWRPAGDGSAIITSRDGTSLAVDFSRASGADAMLVMTGPGAPNQGQTIEAGGRSFKLLFVTQGPSASPEVRGDKIVVGKQTVSFENGNLVLAKMAGPWQPGKAQR